MQRTTRLPRVQYLFHFNIWQYFFCIYMLPSISRVIIFTNCSIIIKHSSRICNAVLTNFSFLKNVTIFFFSSLFCNFTILFKNFIICISLSDNTVIYYRAEKRNINKSQNISGNRFLMFNYEIQEIPSYP